MAGHQPAQDTIVAQTPGPCLEPEMLQMPQLPRMHAAAAEILLASLNMANLYSVVSYPGSCHVVNTQGLAGKT